MESFILEKMYYTDEPEGDGRCKYSALLFRAEVDMSKKL